jgi:hypothetical protein
MSPAALALLQDLRRRGVEVRARGTEIVFWPRSLVPAEDVDLIKAHRGDLLRILSSRPDFLLVEGRLCPVTWLSPTGRPPHYACRACSASHWWRLRGEFSSTRRWVCGRCHAPDLAQDEIEWASEVAG